MFNDILLNLDNKLVSIDVSNKALVESRLKKLNESYLYDLLLSKKVLESRAQKTILKRVSKQWKKYL